MFTGKTPFSANTEYLIFQKIKKTALSIPNVEFIYLMKFKNIPSDAADLIAKLLVRNPRKRLGAGEPGSENDFQALKNHSFFSGINFETLPSQNPPALNYISPFKIDSLKKDEEEFVHLNPYKYSKENSYQLSPKKDTKDLSEIDYDNENMTIYTPEKEKNQIILTGQVLKKCGWIFYKVRQLVLKKNKTLLYYNPKNNELKGNIQITSEMKAKLEGKKKWSFNTPKRDYEHPAEEWVKTINEVISEK